jgi:hypothetical protein
MHTPRRAVPSACSSVNYSPFSAAQDPLPRHCLPTAEACVSGTRARSRITYQPLQGAQRCIDKRRTRKMQLDARNTSTRGVKACIASSRRIVVIFLERPSADLPSSRIFIATLAPACMYHTIVFTLTRCAPVDPATFSQRARADGAALAIHHLARSARV